MPKVVPVTPEPDPVDFVNAHADAVSRVALLLGLAEAKQHDSEDADLWAGVSLVVKELEKDLDAMREADHVQSDRLHAFEHPEEAKEFNRGLARSLRRAVKGGAR